MNIQKMDLDQLLSWVRIGNDAQAQEAWRRKYTAYCLDKRQQQRAAMRPICEI